MFISTGKQINALCVGKLNWAVYICKTWLMRILKVTHGTYTALFHLMWLHCDNTKLLFVVFSSLQNNLWSWFCALYNNYLWISIHSSFTHLQHFSLTLMDQKEWKEKKFGSQFATGGSGLFFFLSLKLYLIISYTAERVPEIISVKTPTTPFK